MQSIHTRELTAAALFCALTAICSQISLPLPFTPVPINLAAFAVLAAAGLLGCRGAVLSIAAYLLLGAAGVPVFAGFRGGLSVLAGPTGGYLAGYLAAAWITGWLLKAPGKKAFATVLAMAAGLAACYLLGTVWFLMLTGSGLAAALGSCVIPFLPGDAVKIAAAAFLTQKLQRKARHLSI